MPDMARRRKRDQGCRTTSADRQLGALLLALDLSVLRQFPAFLKNQCGLFGLSP
jgi:hypothetical protein